MSALQSSGLARGFLASAARFPGRPALEVGGVPVTYDELRERATAVASTLFAHAPAEPRLTAVLGHRTVGAFAGVLGVALREGFRLALGLLLIFPPYAVGFEPRLFFRLATQPFARLALRARLRLLARPLLGVARGLVLGGALALVDEAPGIRFRGGGARIGAGG